MDIRRKSALLAEAFGTFALVFAGTGAIIINDVANGQPSSAWAPRAGGRRRSSPCYGPSPVALLDEGPAGEVMWQSGFNRHIGHENIRPTLRD